MKANDLFSEFVNANVQMAKASKSDGYPPT